ncbi:uncharacterized protein DEA37_0001352 [Paragonimus westermani]|uniref:Uncharacterized protein n=1 Tax=Paragonimus westermani TaxID=34504 RepID=A0A5J4NZC0_9TREM|nr:uncharacterized protein DEA37_0001352 [Paragonimus westermani]
MDPADDFVVVDEEAATSQKMALDRLHVLIDLFSKALDAVNQSNILLKDELRSALSVTLQHIDADYSSSTDDLIKTLESNVTGVEDVRANYVRRLCSRLVAVNEEKQALVVEQMKCKDDVKNKEKETEEHLADLSLTIRSIEELISRFEGQSATGDSLQSGSAVQFTSMTDLSSNLNTILERLSKLKLIPKEDQATKEEPTSSCTATQTCDFKHPPVLDRCQDRNSETSDFSGQASTVGCSVSTQQSVTLTDQNCQAASLGGPFSFSLIAFVIPEFSIGSHWSRLSPCVPPELIATGEDITSRVGRNSPNISATTLEGATRADTHPSFTAHEEEPWCPCCHQRLASRDDLETHLQQCLEQ